MPLPLADKIKPKNGGDFPLVDAEDVEMPDGKRLSEFTSCYPVRSGTSTIKPEIFYTFGRVDELKVNLEPVNDGKVHEYCFEFIPTDKFTLLEVEPQPNWVSEPLYFPGSVYHVSIVRGLGVIVGA